MDSISTACFPTHRPAILVYFHSRSNKPETILPSSLCTCLVFLCGPWSFRLPTWNVLPASLGFYCNAIWMYLSLIILFKIASFLHISLFLQFLSKTFRTMWHVCMFSIYLFIISWISVEQKFQEDRDMYCFIQCQFSIV